VKREEGKTLAIKHRIMSLDNSVSEQQHNVFVPRTRGATEAPPVPTKEAADMQSSQVRTAPKSKSAAVEKKIHELELLRAELSLRLDKAREERQHNWQTLLGSVDSAAAEDIAASSAPPLSSSSSASSLPLPSTVPSPLSSLSSDISSSSSSSSRVNQAPILSSSYSPSFSSISAPAAAATMWTAPSPGTTKVTVRAPTGPLSLKQLDKATLVPTRRDKLNKLKARRGQARIRQQQHSSSGHDSLREKALLDIMQREAKTRPLQ